MTIEVWRDAHMGIRILLVDDHPIILKGLRWAIRQQPDMIVVGSATHGLKALHMAVELVPDVVLMDYELPDICGAEATRRILEALPGTKVLALSQFDDYPTVSSMVAAGVKGYAKKTIEAEELILAIRTVAAGHPYISPELSIRLASQPACTEEQLADLAVQIARPPESLDRLSRREREVLQLACEGKTAKETAGVLGISRRTVEFHLSQTKQKLGIDNLAGLVKYAIRARLTDL